MFRPQILILGAGFGGTYVAKRLIRLVKRREIDLTIVDRTNYFLFTPLLHEVATGSLSPRSVAEPLREAFVHSGIRIVQGAVDAIEPDQRSVRVRAGSGRISLAYDYLVIATGAETNFYGIQGAEDLALPLKTLADAARVRSRVIEAFEQAVLEPDPAARRALLSFVVVGGGPTGDELAAEMADFPAGLVKRYYGCTQCPPEEDRACGPEEPSVTLINSGERILARFPVRMRQAAERRLAEKGVSVKNRTNASSVSKSEVALSTGGSIPAAVVVWTAGVKPSAPHFDGRSPETLGGRLAVDRNFKLVGDERVYALGDVAAYAEGEPLPMLAQAAVAEARIVAHNIVAEIKGAEPSRLRYMTPGALISVGRWFAVGEIFSVSISGRLTWWLWRTVYLFKFASWRKRVRIGFEWAFELVSPRDITKI